MSFLAKSNMPLMLACTSRQISIPCHRGRLFRLFHAEYENKPDQMKSELVEKKINMRGGVSRDAHYTGT